MPKPRYKPLKTTASEREVMRGCFDAFALFQVDDANRQNTGGMKNDKGRYVAFGKPGDTDIGGTLPLHFAPYNGRTFHCECKREGFDPKKCYGKERARFEKQLDRIRRTNEAGGYGWWTSDPAEVIQILGRIKEGWTIRIADDEMVELLEPEDRT